MRGVRPPAASAGALGAGEAFALEFAAVHGYEPVDDTLKPVRSVDALRERSFDAGTTALCLSGGGIRSASFALGVVQGMARRGLLSKFDYLSTVSGGGYLGGMVAAWSYRAQGGSREVERELCEEGDGAAMAALRQYLRYLAPKGGMLSLDTWTLVSTYVRNFLLNALIWLPAIGVVLALPWLVATGFDAIERTLESRGLGETAGQILLGAGLALILYSTLELRRAIARDRDPGPARSAAAQGLRRPDALAQPEQRELQQPHPTFAPPANRRVQGSLFTGVLVLALGAYLLGHADPGTFWRGLSREGSGAPWAALPLPASTPAPVLLGALLALFHAGLSWGYKPAPSVDAGYRVVAALAGAVCGFVTGVATGLVVAAFIDGGPLAGSLPLFVTLVPPALVAAVGLGEIVFVGGISRFSSDFDREWWSRAGAWSSIFAAGWLALFGLAFYGPELLQAITELDFGMSAYALTLALAGLVARLAMGRESPSAEARPTWRALLADRSLDIAALVALVAILIGIAWLLERAILFVATLPWPMPLAHASDALPFSIAAVLLLIVVLGIVVGVAGLCVNVNRFSLHAMYRDRLIRTFLGATRRGYPKPPWPPDDAPSWRESAQFAPRDADRFIKFDRDDNPILRWLAPWRAPEPRKAPLLVVNAALNLVAGANLAWQERKAASFTFTPIAVGSPVLGYRPSGEYAREVGGLTLGTAMAVSGAAVSPNAGALSSPVRTFLLTLFNARLGWWLGHPDDLAAVRSAGPKFAVGALLDELLGRTREQKRWLFVSDGGHFENLGLYEMVRRGCRDIVVVDASCDPDRNFDDLGNAIRKVRIDLGVRIERSGPWTIGGRELQAQGRYCALFDVLYPGERTGSLLYIKPTLYPKAEGLPIDVLQYAGRSTSFPHESTARQFFGEAQFESYRALGEFEVDAMIEGTETPYPPQPTPIESVAEFIEIAALRMAE